jgi:hypothetical protein
VILSHFNQIERSPPYLRPTCSTKMKLSVKGFISQTRQLIQ